ncbi:MAG: hypothetical protein ABW085_09435 [Sedimenticola sp.]
MRRSGDAQGCIYAAEGRKPGSGGPFVAQAMIDVYRQDAGSDGVKYSTSSKQ